MSLEETNLSSARKAMKVIIIIKKEIDESMSLMDYVPGQEGR